MRNLSVWSSVLQSFAVIGSVTLTVCASAQIPRLNTLYPIGGKVGTSVEVELRGSNLTGADTFIVNSPYLTGKVDPSVGKPDETHKPVWQNKCGSCHELRSPSNRSLTPQQWSDVVERMVKVRQAPLSADESTKVTQYLQGMARAGRVSAHLNISPDAKPGLYEVRVSNPKGVSTVGLFEVGNLPEITGAPGTLETAPTVQLPCIANGSITGNYERHFFKFTAKQGQRLVFNLKGFRYNILTQMFFNPNLRLYDNTGKEIQENHGYFELDPLIDWMCQKDGDYTLEVRDILGRGNPGSVYRMSMGQVGYDTVAYPPALTGGKKSNLRLIGKNLPGGVKDCTVEPAAGWGLQLIGTPEGSQQVFVTPLTINTFSARKPVAGTFPCGFTGRLDRAEPQTFTVDLPQDTSLEFESYSTKLGSPANVVVQVLNAKGEQVARVEPEQRTVVKLAGKQTYTVRVQETGALFGNDYVYYVEARPAQPNVVAVLRPDTITLRAGGKTAAEVLITRRERTAGNLSISAENLPDGVTAESIEFPPDRNQGFIIFTASPNAKVGDIPINVNVGVTVDDKTLHFYRAKPEEQYVMNNQARYTERTQSILSVRPSLDVKFERIDSGPVRVHPRKGVEMKIKIDRSGGYKGGVVFLTTGLPSGWIASAESVGGDKNEVTLTIRPDGNNTQPFLKRDLKLTRLKAIVEAIIDEYRYFVTTFEVIPQDNIVDDEGRPL